MASTLAAIARTVAAITPDAQRAEQVIRGAARGYERLWHARHPHATAAARRRFAQALRGQACQLAGPLATPLAELADRMERGSRRNRTPRTRRKS